MRASDSVQISASSDLSGVSRPQVAGTVDAQFGIVALSFGSWVADAGAVAGGETRVVVCAERVVSGQIFRPRW
jgi:hypothetical protein